MSNDWRKLAKDGKHEQIDWLSLPHSDQKALLALIKVVAPSKGGRFLLPHEIEITEAELHDVRSAAQILALGELEAAVDFPEDIPPYIQRRAETKQATRDSHCAIL